MPSPILALSSMMLALLYLMNIFPAGGENPIQRSGDIHFGEDDCFGGGEQHGIFDRLILAFRRGEQGDLELFAEVEGGGADHVFDVFDKEHLCVILD